MIIEEEERGFSQKFRIIIFLFLLTTFLILFNLVTYSQNLINNPSFENSDLSSYFQGQWTGATTISLETTFGHTGSHCLKIVGVNGSATVWQVITVSPNTNYNAYVWVNTSGLSGAGKTGLEIKSNSTYYYISPDNQPNDGNWHKININFNNGSATELTVICAYEMYGNGTGTAYYDDLTLTESFTPPPLPTPPYTLTSGIGPSGKRGFFLNGTWFHPVVYTRGVSPPPGASDIQGYKANCINILYVPLNDASASSADTITFLNNCQANSMPVMIEWNTKMWASWLQADQSRNLELSPDHPGSQTHIQYFPDYAKSEVQNYVKAEINNIVTTLNSYHHNPIIAYSISAYDFYHLPDGEAHILFNTVYPHPLGEGNQTWVPYGSHITTDFRQFLTDNSVSPTSIGFSSISEVTTPYDKFTAENELHWNWWIRYRRFFVSRFIDVVIGKFKSICDLPITGTYDLNFSLNDNFATPIPSVVGIYDFFIYYYYNAHLPALLEAFHQEAERAGKSAWTMFEFSSQVINPIPISEYMQKSLPYVSGFHFQYDNSLYSDFVSQIQTFYTENLWETKPPTANLAIYIHPADIYHWEKGYWSGRFLDLYNNNYPFDVIYNYSDFSDYSSVYIPPKQPILASDSSAQLVIQSFKNSGGIVLSTLYKLFSNPYIAFNFENDEGVHAYWIAGNGQGSLTMSRNTSIVKNGTYSEKWEYTLPPTPSGNWPMVDMRIPEQNLTDLEKIGGWFYFDLTGPKPYWIINFTLLRRNNSAVDLGYWYEGIPGVPNKVWTYHEWSVSSGLDLEEVEYLRMSYHAGDSWQPVASGGKIPIYIDDISFKFYQQANIENWDLY